MISTCSKAGCYAVLASLSGRYPPFEGRSPTCYSPVRHSTKSRSPFRVRLACVRHAASVDSEPGSNSHVKDAVSTLAGEGNCLTRSPVDLALRCFRTSCLVDGSSASALARFDERHPLTLDGLSSSTSRLTPLSFAGRLLCLHALSSFQRTGSPTSHASRRQIGREPHRSAVSDRV